MRVRDLMTREVIAVAPDDTCERARGIMQAAGIGRLAVIDASRLVGILTDGDLRRRVPYAPQAADRVRSQQQLLPHVKVGGVMTFAPVTALPGTLLDDAAALMRERGIGTLPVLDGERLVGILTRGDILRAGDRGVERRGV
jgi:acetoin utilization protein AcuB